MLSGIVMKSVTVFVGFIITVTGSHFRGGTVSWKFLSGFNVSIMK